jgi:hypothetical protein
LDRRLLDPRHNTRFLRRCIGGFRRVDFAEQATGRIYLRIESGTPVWMDAALLQAAIADPDTLSGLEAVAPGALRGEIAPAAGPQYLYDEEGAGGVPTLGSWGAADRRGTKASG